MLVQLTMTVITRKSCVTRAGVLVIKQQCWLCQHILKVNLMEENRSKKKNLMEESNSREKRVITGVDSNKVGSHTAKA